MTYLALYRAWRPQTFEDVIGQQHITQTLKNALKENRFSHAYLFNGPRGTGKTSTAKILAKAVNCESGPSEEPCNQCKVCKGITKGLILDVIEIDAASNRGVEEIRDLREKIRFAPTESKYKVYIIDEVHMLTTEAFNALLKTLEEPPPHVIFILATTEPHKLPATIISRCQRFNFKRISTEEMAKRLSQIIEAEGFTLDFQTLTLIARHSEGGMRDALSLLDQILSFSGEKADINDVLRIIGKVSDDFFSQIARAIFNNETAKVLNAINQFLQEGKDSEKIMEDLLYYYRDLLLYKSAPSLEEIKTKLLIDKEFPLIAELYSEEQIFRILEVLNTYLNEMRRTNQPQIMLELGIVKAAKTISSQTEEQNAINNAEINELRTKIRELEYKLEQLSANQPVMVETTNTEKLQATPNKIILNNDQTLNRLEQLHIDSSNNDLQKLTQIWPKVLQTVKHKKITAHAWLIDGEPVAIADEHIIIAFNNLMHRDTTNKNINRQLIEEIIFELIGKRYSLFNIMKKDWRIFYEKRNGQIKTPSEIEEQQEEDLLAKAIELFGENLVEVKD